MLWSEWLTAIAPILGVTVGEAGVILGLLFSAVFSLLGGLISTENVTITMGIPSFFGVLIFTYANWLPYFTGSAIAIIIALLIARELSG